MSFTPGPWAWTEQPEGHGTFRLIAAVPEMYALLAQIIKERWLDGTTVGDEAKALLARIDGDAKLAEKAEAKR